MFKKLLIFLIIITLTIPSFCNDDLINELNNKIDILQKIINTQDKQIAVKDSIIREKNNAIKKNNIEIELNELLLNSKNKQIYQWKEVNKQDSLIIVNLKKQNELIKPKWYENKYLWFGYGIITVLGSSYVVKNTLD